MKEITPMQYSSEQTRRIKYKRIRKEALNREVLETLWKEANAKENPEILEDNRLICFQYPNKPILLISKKDGKIYSLEKETVWLRHHAGFILRILNDFGLVEEYERKTTSRKPLKIGWE